jgi:hypothetical protein
MPPPPPPPEEQQQQQREKQQKKQPEPVQHPAVDEVAWRDLGEIAATASCTVVVFCPPQLRNGIWCEWWADQKNRYLLQQWVSKTGWRRGTSILFSSGLRKFGVLRHLQQGGLEVVFCNSELPLPHNNVSTHANQACKCTWHWKCLA